MPDWQRARVSKQLVDALIANPLFARGVDAMFHADPGLGVADHVAWTGLEAVLIPYPLVAAKISDTGKPKFNITSDATSPAPFPRPAAAPLRPAVQTATDSRSGL